MKPDLTIDPQNVTESFRRIASDLMNNWSLCVGDHRYRIAEIEFYYNEQKEHADGYTHNHELQKKSGTWYFHGSGIDITIGNGSAFGGILIRAIFNRKEDKYVYGPLNIITELVAKIAKIEKHDIEFGLEENMKDEDIWENEELIAAPRVGLNASKDPKKKDAHYRFLIMPKKQHADKQKIATAMRQNGCSDDRIKAIWG